jgi:hypothetical protein
LQEKEIENDPGEVPEDGGLFGVEFSTTDAEY